MDKKNPRIAQLKKRQEQLKAQIQALEAREKAQERKKDTRRKILVGSYYLDKAMKENNWTEIQTIMAQYLTRESDRALFDLKQAEHATTE